MLILNKLSFWALFALSVYSLSYDPLPDPGAVVIVGNNTRVTVLTPTLLRIDAKPSSLTSFDDRATLTVVNRLLSVPKFTVIPLNASAVRIETGMLNVTVHDGDTTKGDTCGFPAASTDADSPSNSPTYPGGVVFPNGTLQSLTQAQCCAICNSDIHCLEWVWATDSGNCWPLAASPGRHDAVNRTMGGSTSLARGISIDFLDPTTGAPVTWTPFTHSFSNLNGTYSFLDCYGMGPMECNAVYDSRMGAGLLSREGWSTFNDARTARLVPDSSEPAGLKQWWALDAAQPTFDVYFQFSPSLDYKAALREWASVLGQPAMLPRSAFGVWWSRYYNYTQSSIVSEVLQGYANFSIPLNNLVFDMDWHQEPSDPTCATWGNWDVDPYCFPDMEAFSSQLHEHGIVLGNAVKLSLNTHPDTGVDHCDSRYPQIATAMGIDPASNRTVPCDFGNATFFNSLTSVYMDSAPLGGSVDMWWTDYNGCGESGGNPLLWSNLAMWSHMEARGRRGHAFSRYGGLGNHRYPHGFSGDTFQHEVALYHQIKTTQTAANVMWGYWSHDIGGFHDGSQGGTGMSEAPGDHDPTNITGSELLLRWIQFGAVSPIFRTHCNHCERRIWNFPYHFQAMRDAFRLRNALQPYIYTEARAFFDTACAPVHPLYYEDPRDPQLYTPSVVERVFMHGDRLLAAPITSMLGVLNGTISWPVYLPESTKGGDQSWWSNWNGTEVYEAGPVEGLRFGLGDIPLFVRGGLVPLKSLDTGNVAALYPDPLVWALFPGSPMGTYTLYEDDGESDAYVGGESVTLTANFSASPTAIAFTLSPAVASAALPSGFPVTRGLILQVRGARVRFSGSPQSVRVNGVAIPSVPSGSEGVCSSTPGWYYIGDQEHSLVTPEGTLVVCAGQKLSSWEATQVIVDF